jgi:hypothetical protein
MRTTGFPPMPKMPRSITSSRWNDRCSGIGATLGRVCGAQAESAATIKVTLWVCSTRESGQDDGRDRGVGIAPGSASRIALFVVLVLVLLELCDRPLADGPAVLAGRGGDGAGRDSPAPAG